MRIQPRAWLLTHLGGAHSLRGTPWKGAWLASPWPPCHLGLSLLAGLRFWEGGDLLLVCQKDPEAYAVWLLGSWAFVFPPFSSHFL